MGPSKRPTSCADWSLAVLAEGAQVASKAPIRLMDVALASIAELGETRDARGLAVETTVLSGAMLLMTFCSLKLYSYPRKSDYNPCQNLRNGMLVIGVTLLALKSLTIM